MSRAVLIVACTLLMGCFRTHYANFSPQNPIHAAEDYAPARVASWQSFFVWGWFPVERRIDARERCGGEANIDSVETRVTFLQGLIAAFAGYYVNVYSPWTGAVYCTGAPPPK